jgi:hypothetical protein
MSHVQSTFDNDKFNPYLVLAEKISKRTRFQSYFLPASQASTAVTSFLPHFTPPMAAHFYKFSQLVSFHVTTTVYDKKSLFDGCVSYVVISPLFAFFRLFHFLVECHTLNLRL